MARRKAPKHVPTPEDNAYFWSRVKYHQSRLNLNNWRIEEGDCEPPKDAFATCVVLPEDQLALIKLGCDFSNTPVTKEALDSTALHEVLHIFLTGLKAAILSEEDGRISAEEHSIIIVLENLLATPKELL